MHGIFATCNCKTKGLKASSYALTFYRVSTILSRTSHFILFKQQHKEKKKRNILTFFLKKNKTTSKNYSFNKKNKRTLLPYCKVRKSKTRGREKRKEKMQTRWREVCFIEKLACNREYMQTRSAKHAGLFIKTCGGFQQTMQHFPAYVDLQIRRYAGFFRLRRFAIQKHTVPLRRTLPIHRP